ncbi:MAG: amino acid permease [Myxococcaceae bacterium]
MIDDDQQAKDAEQLRKLGYAQELLRGMGGFSNFALSFSIISILTGAVTLYGHGLKYGGPLVMLLGWPLVCVMTLFVAASIAQLASSFPTAGALYHWSAMLGGPGLGFFTAWFNLLGQVAITAGVNYGLAELLNALFGWPPDRAHVLGIYAVLLVVQALLNHLGVKVVAVLNDFSAWYHIGGVVVLVGAVLLFAKRQPASFLLSKFNGSDHAYVYAFLVGLLQAQWTFTGFDASAHVTEETRDPARNAPWGVFLSVVVSGVVGFVMLVVVTLAISDLPAAVAAQNSFLAVLEQGLGHKGVILGAIVAAAMWFCGVSSVTSNSRMMYAFARDDGMPLSRYLKQVSPRFKSPHVAVWVSAALAFVVAVWAQAYSAMVALSTIALYASYAVPIAVGLSARSSGKWQRRGPWDLGGYSAVVNAVAILWIAVITVLFVLPPNELAGYTFGGAFVALCVYWFAYMRKRFVGPRVTAG